MSDIDPEKLKVAELRDELKARGLDTKGNKAALVARLKESLSSSAPPADEAEAAEDGDETDTENAVEPEPQDEVALGEDVQLVDEIGGEEGSGDNDDNDNTPAEGSGDADADTMQNGDKETEGTEEKGQEDVEMKAEDQDQEEDQAQQEGAEDVDEEHVVLGEEFQTIDEASQDDNEEGDTSRKRKRSRSPRQRRSRSRSRDRHRRHQRFSPPPRKVEMDDTAWESLTEFTFDRYNADLNLRFDDKKMKAQPLSVDGFAYMWSGVRATFGVTNGKVAYEAKILENLKVSHLRDEINPHVLRIGWSVDSSSLNLGEEVLSYGYGGTGKASTECKFVDYGQSFGPGDVVTAYLDLENDPAVISYSKNGEDLGMCFEVEKEKLGDQALFPHFMTKNTEFECNFGAQEEAWFPLKEGFVFLENVEQESRVRGTTPPATKEECEVIMMVGLPGSGKTVWAGKHASEHPEKRFYVLGTNNIIDKMKVMGLPRKQNYSGRWEVLIGKSTKCLNRLIEIAARKKHNYIIDQTNVYASARRRKMQPFEGFQRKAVVVLPTDEEFKNRVKQRTEEEGKDVPASAVLEMKANFTLPEDGQIFSSVEFCEEEHEKEEREKLVEKYRKEGRDALPPPDKRFRRDRFDNRDFRGDRRGGFRGGFDRERRGGFRGGRGFNSWRPYNDRRGDFRGGYRDDRRRDDRREGGYKGYGGGGSWGGGSGWNQGWGGQSYQSGWGGNVSGYSGGGGGGWGHQSYSSGWGGGRGGGGYGGGQSGYHRGWNSYR